MGFWGGGCNSGLSPTWLIVCSCLEPSSWMPVDTFCPSPLTTHFSVGAWIYSPRMVIGSDRCGLFIQLPPQGKHALASPTEPASEAGALPGLGTQHHQLKEPPRAWITPLIRVPRAGVWTWGPKHTVHLTNTSKMAPSHSCCFFFNTVFWKIK